MHRAQRLRGAKTAEIFLETSSFMFHRNKKIMQVCNHMKISKA